MTDSIGVPAYRAVSTAELMLIRALRSEADVDFAAQFHQDRFLDWSRLALHGTLRADLALQIEIHGAGWTLGWIGSRAAGSGDQAFWGEIIARVRAAA